jgi:hypothetical protein
MSPPPSLKRWRNSSVILSHASAPLLRHRVAGALAAHLRMSSLILSASCTKPRKSLPSAAHVSFTRRFMSATTPR